MKIVILITVLLFGCTVDRSDKREHNNISSSNDSLMLTIQEKIDSATILYDSAIFDAVNGRDKQLIINKYESKVFRLHNLVSILLDSINASFIKNRRNKNEYDEYIGRINFLKASEKSKELKDLGVTFNLKDTIAR